MVRKRLEKGFRSKVSLVRELILLAKEHSIPMLKVDDITITTVIRPESPGIGFTKTPTKANVDSKAPTSRDVEDVILFGTKFDDSKV